MVGSIWLEGIVSQQSQINERTAMEAATAIATEAVVSIKTVQSLGKKNFKTICSVDHQGQVTLIPKKFLLQ